MSKQAISQSSLFDTNHYDVEPSWDVNDYETPDGTDGSMRLAQAFAALLKDVPGDRLCDCSAGSGRMAQFYPADTTCMELNPLREKAGRDRAPHCRWLQGNFLKTNPMLMSALVPGWKPWRAIATNPPFSEGMQFIRHALALLEPDGFLQLLLPGDFFCSQERADEAEAMGLIFEHKWMIRGRVEYLKSDVRIRGRQISDAIYRIRFQGVQPGCSILKV